MKRYFVPSKHFDLIHPEYRDDELMEYLSVEVQRDILDEKRLPYPEDRAYTFSTFFFEDPSQADPQFRRDFRRTVAKVMEHRIKYQDFDETIRSYSIMNESVERSKTIDPEWPERWDQLLWEYEDDYQIETWYL